MELNFFLIYKHFSSHIILRIIKVAKEIKFFCSDATRNAANLYLRVFFIFFPLFLQLSDLYIFSDKITIIYLQKSSFNKFDALSKKTVLHVRSVDAAKVQQQLNAVSLSLFTLFM